MNITDLNRAMKKESMGSRENLWGTSPQHLFGAVALFERGQELSVTGERLPLITWSLGFVKMVLIKFSLSPI